MWKKDLLIKIATYTNVSLELKQEVVNFIVKDIDKKSKHWNTVNEICINIKLNQLLKKLKDRTLTEDELRKITKEVLTTEIHCKENKKNVYKILFVVVKHQNSSTSLAMEIRECISNDKTIHKDLQMRNLMRIDRAILEKKGNNIQNASEALSATITIGK